MGYENFGYDDKKNYYRFRQFNPKEGKKYISVKIKFGIIFVIEL